MSKDSRSSVALDRRRVGTTKRVSLLSDRPAVPGSYSEFVYDGVHYVTMGPPLLGYVCLGGGAL